MKTICTCVLGIGCVLALVLSVNLYSPVVAPQTSSSVQWPAFPLNKPQAIDFGESIQETSPVQDVHFRNASYWNGYSTASTGRREQLDQWRDWLLLTVLSSSTMSSEQLNQALYDLPPVRRTELQALANFEYGVTRSRAIGDGEVVAVIPQVNLAQRSIELGHVADEQRKDLGKIPSRIHVFLYSFDSENNSATVTRIGEVTGEDLFSDKYGYREMNVASLQDFTQFMSQVDDVTYARFDNGKLRVGGRKVPGYHGITPEYVAAIWQSEKNGLGGLRGSGFSLDPEIDPNLMRIAGIKMDQNMRSRGVPSVMGERLVTSLKDGDADSFWSAANDICTDNKHPELCLEYFKQILLEARFQRARYDGSLQGTQVGMVLFYTDLLMKLWGLDYEGATPRKTQIEDFPVKVEMQLANVYAGETKALPETRLWLGSLDKAFQIGPNKAEILLARNATRVFAVPHDSLQNKDITASSEPNIYNRVLISWWNQHYEEVAKFEPQYERLNEIMKWSQIISWLNSSQGGQGLAFLDAYQVRHDNWFPNWVTQHPELTFHNWRAIKFKDKTDTSLQTEALPLLRSRYFTDFGEKNHFFQGGVSLADREALAARSAVREDFNALARRGSLDYSESDLAAGRLKTIEKIEYDLAKTAQSEATVVARAVDPQARLRGLIGEFRNEGLERSISRNPETSVFSVSHGDSSVGKLLIEHRSGGFRIGWEARELDEAQAIARDLSISTDEKAALSSNPLIESSVQIEKDGYMVKARNSNRWMKLRTTAKEELTIPDGYQARIGGYGKDSKTVNIAFLKNEDALQQFPKNGFAEVTIEDGENSNSLNFVSSPPSGAVPFEAEYMGNPVKLFIDQPSGKMYFSSRSIPADLQLYPERLRLLARQTHIDNRVLQNMRVSAEYSQGNFTALARELSTDPVSARNAMNAALNRELDLYDRLALDNGFGSSRLLDDMISRYGLDLPDLRIRKALAELTRNQPQRAATLAKDISDSQFQNRQPFLSEINNRITHANGVDLENLEQFQSYVKAMGDHNLGGSSHLVPISKDGRFMVEYRVDHLEGQSAQFSDIYSKNKPALVYVQDSPSLNNIDLFSESGRRSLDSMFEHGQVSIRKISSMPLEEYRPGVILEEGSQTKLRSREASLPRPILRSFPQQGCNPQEGSQDCPDVYIISESRGRS